MLRDIVSGGHAAGCTPNGGSAVFNLFDSGAAAMARTEDLSRKPAFAAAPYHLRHRYLLTPAFTIPTAALFLLH